MRYNEYKELERYYNQLISLVITKSDYPFDSFQNLKSFYRFQINTLRAVLKTKPCFKDYELSKPKIYERIKLLT